MSSSPVVTATKKRSRVLEEQRQQWLEQQQKKTKTSFTANVIELERLIHAMEQSKEMNTTATALRVETCWALWRQVASQLQQDNPTEHQRLGARVEKVCAGAPVCTMDPLVQDLFFSSPSSPSSSKTVQSSTPSLQSVASSSVVGEDKDHEPVRLSAPTSETQRTPQPSVQDMQKEQQQQIEHAISMMATKLKDETAKIHSTLQQQAGHLDEMEDLAADNVSEVTKVAQDVQTHVSKSWSKTVGTWTMLFTLLGAFCFAILTIVMIPKRPGACFFNCPPRTTTVRMCRTRNGQTECFVGGDEATAGPTEMVWDSVASKATEKECTVGVDGTCILDDTSSPPSPPPKVELRDPSETVKQPAARKEPSKQKRDLKKGPIEQQHNGVPPKAQPKQTGPKKTPENGADKRKRSEPSVTKEAPKLPVFSDEFLDNGAVGAVTEERPAQSKKDKEKPKGSVIDPDVPVYKGKPFSAANLRKAAASGDLATLSGLLDARPDLVNTQDINGWSALHLAARAGHEDVVRYLLDRGVDASLQTLNGQDALHVAYNKLGSDHSITQRLQALPGAKHLTSAEPTTYTGEDLRQAAENGRREKVKNILSTSPSLVESADENGWAAIHLAARAGHSRIVEDLLQAGCRSDLRTRSGATALSIAERELGTGHRIVRKLTSLDRESGPTHSAPMIRGKPFTAEDVRFISQQGNLFILKEMGAVRPDWLHAQDENGWAPIHQAARGGHVQTLQYLLEQGCDPRLATVSGHTARDIAEELVGGDSAAAELLLRATEG